MDTGADLPAVMCWLLSVGGRQLLELLIQSSDTLKARILTDKSSRIEWVRWGKSLGGERGRGNAEKKADRSED